MHTSLKRFFTILVMALSGVCVIPMAANAESTINCPAGTYDMVDWMTLDADLRGSKHMGGTHFLGTSLWPDKIWWVKHASGNIWDTWLYNGSNVYWYLTEMDQGASWDDPMASRNFKKATYDTNFKVASRCQQAGGRCRQAAGTIPRTIGTRTASSRRGKT